MKVRRRKRKKRKVLRKIKAPRKKNITTVMTRLKGRLINSSN